MFFNLLFFITKTDKKQILFLSANKEQKISILISFFVSIGYAIYRLCWRDSEALGILIEQPPKY